MADSSLIAGEWKSISISPSEILFTLKTRVVLVNEFLSYVSNNQRPSSLSPKNYMQQLYNSFVETVINQTYEEQLIKANPDYEMLLKEYYEGILLFDIMEKVVWNKASEDTVGQRNYFNEHASEYVAGERVVAELYSATVQENNNLLSTALQKNDSSAIQELLNSRKVRLEKGTFQKEDRSVLSKIEWKKGDYSAESNGMYYLVRVLEMKPPGPMTLEEARAAVTSDYQNYLEKNWVEQLKKKYSVKINEKGKQSVFKQLVHE